MDVGGDNSYLACGRTDSSDLGNTGIIISKFSSNHDVVFQEHIDTEVSLEYVSQCKFRSGYYDEYAFITHNEFVIGWGNADTGVVS